MSVEEILNGLRRRWTYPRDLPDATQVVPLDDAVAAVHAAADTRTREILRVLDEEGCWAVQAKNAVACDDGKCPVCAAAEIVARRFPNGGTPDPNDDSAGA